MKKPKHCLKFSEWRCLPQYVTLLRYAAGIPGICTNFPLDRDFKFAEDPRRFFSSSSLFQLIGSCWVFAGPRRSQPRPLFPHSSIEFLFCFAHRARRCGRARWRDSRRQCVELFPNGCGLAANGCRPITNCLSVCSTVINLAEGKVCHEKSSTFQFPLERFHFGFH